jgi:hypothetical protein
MHGGRRQQGLWPPFEHHYGLKMELQFASVWAGFDKQEKNGELAS